MQIGLALRNMGALSTPETLLRTARAAEAAGLDGIWVTDHLAIPPEEAEGSDGRYLDPLATLAYLAAATRRIRLGTAVLILPYRAPLPTAKWLATIQELSGGRLVVGVGVGWMEAEFRALGLSRARRGADTDRALDLINRCFAGDVVSENDQEFLFRPRPPRPPILVGGAAPHALRRAVRYADGWLPVRLSPAALAEPMARLAELSAQAGRAPPQVVVMSALPLGQGSAAQDRAEAYREAGVQGIVHAARYHDEAACLAAVEQLAEIEI